MLNQAAHAAARKKGSYFQAVFRRLLPRLGYKSAIWAIADRLCRVVWKILHEGVRFIELEQPGFRRTSGVVNEATLDVLSATPSKITSQMDLWE